MGFLYLEMTKLYQYLPLEGEIYLQVLPRNPLRNHLVTGFDLFKSSTVNSTLKT